MHLSLRENASQVKNHMTAVLGEMLGTAMFLFIVCLTHLKTMEIYRTLMLMENRLTSGTIGRRRCEDSKPRQNRVANQHKCSTGLSDHYDDCNLIWLGSACDRLDVLSHHWWTIQV